jgi:hypothetical protein
VTLSADSLSIPTTPPGQSTNVTITATDGSYTLTNTVTVQ